jgi:hypothetical protein
MTMLVRLIYASRRSANLNADDLVAIQHRSQVNNPKLGITGLLCGSPTVFLQALEGGRDPINSLYKRIVVDSRHSEVTLLAYQEIDQRRFAGWAMGLVDTERLNPAVLLKYSPCATLDPFAMTGLASLALIDDLASTAAMSSDRA